MTYKDTFNKEIGILLHNPTRIIPKRTDRKSHMLMYQRKMIFEGKLFLQLLVILIMKVLIIEGKQNSSCSYRTVDRYVIADCSSRGLLEVPRDLPESTIILSLNHNEITILKEGDFSYLPNLVTIDLSYNNISLLMPGCFRGISSLLRLYLNNNNLKYKTSVFPPEIFNNLIQLRALDIRGNNVDYYDSKLDYPHEALRYLRSLSTLTMDGLSNKVLGEGFGSLTELQNLTMSGYDLTCYMSKLSNQTFYHLGKTKIHVLNISRCYIEAIETGAFSMLKTLKTLSLADNHDLTFNGVKNASFSLTLTNITFLNVGYINKHSKAPINLKADVFSELGNTSLKSLILNGNEIAVIEKTFAFVLPKSIEYLSLRDNKISSSKFLQKIYVLENLQTFDVSYQYHNTEIEDPNFPNALQSKSSKEDPYKLPPKLEVLLASNLKINLYVIPSVSFSNNSLKYVDLSSNDIRHWVGKITGLKALQFLDASNLGLKEVGNSVFGDMAKLRYLNLSYNLIGQHIMEDTEFLTFSNQTELLELDLGHCDISDLPKYMFVNLKKLRKLYLSLNPLVEMKFHLETLINLEELDLSQTEMRSLSDQNMQEINKIINNRNKTLKVNLQVNGLKCTCDEREFLQWMQLKRSVIDFVDFQNYNCTLQNGSVTSLTKINDIITELSVQCISGTVMLACGIMFLVLCLLLAVFAIYYHKRWKFKYLLYRTRRRLKPYHPLRNGDELYDAYVSHSELNAVVAKMKLVFNNKRLRLFDPGADIKANELEAPAIAKGIENSTVLIALLTPEYVKDSLRVFEFNMAVIEGIERQQTTVIPVLLKEIQVKDIEPEMLMFLRSNGFYHYNTEQELWNYLEQEINTIKQDIQ